MTHALSAAYDPSEHPHAPAGSPAGGQFAPSGGTGKSKSAPAKSAPKKSARRPVRRAPADDGTLSYDSKTNHGTGYGSSTGDPRVRKLQQALIRLGLTDSAGKPLKLDGKLGPKTTAAIRKAQHRLGIPVDGKVTPALLDQLAKAKTLTRPTKPATPPKKPMHAAAATEHALRDVELARPGDWKVATGNGKFTVEDLIDAADFYEATGGQAVPIKIGHVDDRWDGEPTFGNVRNVHYLVDERGPVLRGDITDMPEWLSASAPKRWPNRSIEGWRNVEYEGRTYSLVLTGLAFLGVTPPAVRNIRSLADLQTALAASTAERVFASAPPDAPAEPPPDTPAEPPEAPDEKSPGLSAAQPETPAQPAEIPHIEGAGMNLAKYREALAGLPDDASEEDVEAALAAAGFTAQSPAPPDTDALFEVEPVKELVSASGAQRKTDQRLAANAARNGLITIDPAQLAQFQEGMVRAAALTKRLETQERDTVITAALKAGKFPPARRAHYEHSWDVDPDGTREIIASLAAGLIPVTAAGYDADGEDALYEAEYRHLFPATGKGR